MDPLSIIAGVLSIAGAACSASQKLFKLVDGIKGGPEQIYAIARDAHAFYTIIFSLQVALQEENIRSVVSEDPSLMQMIENLRRPLSNCQVLLGQLMVKIESRLKPAADGRGFRMSKRDLKWAFYAKIEVKSLVKRLEATKSTLDNALGAVTTLVSIRLLAMGKGLAAREVKRSSGATNAGFALRRYVEESISSGSVRHSSLPASTRNSQARSSTEENRLDKDLPPPPLPAGDQAGILKSAMSHASLYGPDGVKTPPAELLCRVASIEQPSGTPLRIPSLDEGVDELDGWLDRIEFPADSTMAGLAVETLEAMNSASARSTLDCGREPLVVPGGVSKFENGLGTREAKASAQAGPKELQKASSSPATAPLAVSSSPKNEHTLFDTTTREPNSHGASVPSSMLLKSVADAYPRFPPTAFLSPVTFNTLTEILDSNRRISENSPVILTTLLQLVIRYGNVVDTQSLLDAGASANAKDSESGRTALESASLLTDYPVDIANILHQRGADVNQADEEGWSLLHYAALRGKVKELKWLLEKGASIEVRTKAKRTISGATLDLVTPLQIAASSRHFHSLACLDELLKAGAETDPTADKGYAALHFAARSGSCPAVAILLNAGARLDNSNNPTHTSPLLEAIAHQQLDVLRYLLSLQADCNYQKICGHDPHSLAEERMQIEDAPNGSLSHESIRKEIWKLVKDGSGNALYQYTSNNDPKCIGVGPISYVPKPERRFNRDEVNNKDPSILPLRPEIDDKRISFEFISVSTALIDSSSASSDLFESQLESLRSSPGNLQQTHDSDSDLSEDRRTAKSVCIDTSPRITAAVTDKPEIQSQWKFEFCEPESFELSRKHASVQQPQEESSNSPKGTTLIGIAL